MRCRPGVTPTDAQRDPRTEIDSEARRLLGAVRRELESAVGADSLQADLVAEIYLRLRETLWERRATLARLPLGAPALAQELAVAIFFATSAWRQPGCAEVDHLPALELKLTQALASGKRSETS